MSSGVEFDEDRINYGAPQSERRNAPSSFAGSPTSGGANSFGRQPKMIQWLMDKGIAKSPNMAQMILIGMVIFNLVVTFIVLKFFI